MADLSISCIDGLVGGVYGGEKINTTADLLAKFSGNGQVQRCQWLNVTFDTSSIKLSQDRLMRRQKTIEY